MKLLTKRKSAEEEIRIERIALEGGKEYINDRK